MDIINLDYIRNILIKHRNLVESLDDAHLSRISDCIDSIVDALKKGNKLLVCGNGGSAADSQHMAAEFINRFLLERSPLPAIALSTDTSVLTSISNDYSFDEVFSKQVDALGKCGDILFGISTSGSSGNVLKAFETAKKKEIMTIALTGALPNKIADTADICIDVPSQETPRVQEMHNMIIHMICELVERKMFPAE